LRYPMTQHPMMQRLRQHAKGVGNKTPFVRFRVVPEEARPHLAKALELEVKAGLAVRDGKLMTAEALRREARDCWGAARALGL